MVEKSVAEYGYTVTYERLTEAGYQVIVLALTGIVTYGRTLEEAREMADRRKHPLFPSR